MSAGVTMILFVVGLINSIFSFVTFQNKELQKVGCGMYLLASSITSLLTICMFIIKFWFFVVSEMNGARISLSVLQGGYVSIEPLLKLLLYLDTWLNGCVAVERAVHVFKGASFDRKKSKGMARWIIIMLPFCIITTIVHEPLHRRLFEYKESRKESQINSEETRAWCLTRYSPTVQN